MMIYLFTKAYENHQFFYNTEKELYLCLIDNFQYYYWNKYTKTWFPFMERQEIITRQIHIYESFSNTNNMAYMLCEQYLEKLIFEKL